MSNDRSKMLRRKAQLQARIGLLSGMSPQSCSIIGCGRQPQALTGRGFSQAYCGYHVQHRARHGSLWHATYRSEELRPFLDAASRWITDHSANVYVRHSLNALEATLAGAGEAEIATRLRGLSANDRARIAWARLREAGVSPGRLLSAYLSVCGLMEQDAGTHRNDEFRNVQTAKAIHRLASGHHRYWEIPMRDGTTAPLALHK